MSCSDAITNQGIAFQSSTYSIRFCRLVLHEIGIRELNSNRLRASHRSRGLSMAKSTHQERLQVILVEAVMRFV